MKILATLSLLTLAALSGCADPVLTLPEKKQSGSGANNVKNLVSNNADECPELNDKFYKTDETTGKTSEIDIRTTKADGKISYAFGGSTEFFVAGAEPVKTTMGEKPVSVKLTCGADGISAEIQEEGQEKAETLVYKVSKSKKQIEVEGSGAFATGNGIYLVTGATPEVTPVAPENPAGEQPSQDDEGSDE